jgi:hypothetical protein
MNKFLVLLYSITLRVEELSKPLNKNVLPIPSNNTVEKIVFTSTLDNNASLGQ